jgi:Matrixin
MQFNELPSAETIAELKRRGIAVVQDVPENGLLVTVDRTVRVGDLGVRYAAPIDLVDKISPLMASPGIGANEYFLVEFHPDADVMSARALFSGAGIEQMQNPDLNPHHLLIRALDSQTLARIATLDQVAYIFPASRALVQGTTTLACEGALTVSGPAAQSIPTYGTWAGPGPGSATLGYVFTTLTSQLVPSAEEAQMLLAMAQWSKAVQVNWEQGSNPNAPRTVSIMFATYAHGDGYPFDGPGGIIAHTFFPAPPNPEPIAGDMHLNDSETWRIGSNTDLFSVALHELGHALGLGHSDNPAAVMYPYYQMVTELSPLDIAAIETLYAARTAAPVTTTPVVAPITSTPVTVTPPVALPTPTPTPTPPPTATPGSTDTTAPSLTIASPSSTSVSTSSATIVFSGTASDNVGVTTVTWVTNTGGSGTASGTTRWSAPIPLLVGSNTVTIRASDAAGNVGWRSVVVARY